MGGTTNRTSDLSSGIVTAVRTAREIDLSEPLEVIRTDLSGGLEVGRDLVVDAVEVLAEAVARLQGNQRRRSRRRPAMIGLTLGILGIVGIVALATWWGRRPSADVPDQPGSFDQLAVDRAADEGMGTAIGSSDAAAEDREPVPVAMEIPLATASDVRSS